MFKNLFFLYVLLLGVSYSYAERNGINYSKAVSFYNKELAIHQNNCLFVSKKLIYKWGKSDFPNTKEWNSFIEFCLFEVKKKSEFDYYQLCFEYGDQLSLMGMNEDAFKYLYPVEEFLKNKSSENIHYYYFFHARMGNIYNYFARFSHAKKHLKIIINAPETSNLPITFRLGAYNTLGLISKTSNQIDEAQKYFEKALVIAKKSKSEEWVGILSGNLGGCYYSAHKIDKALPLIELDYKKSCENNEWESSIYALILLAKIDIEKNQLNLANEKLLKVKDLMNNHFHDLFAKKNFWETTYLLEERMGNFRAAYIAQQSFLNYLDTINEQIELTNFHNTEFQIEFQKNQVKINMLSSKKERAEEIMTISWLFVLFILISMIIIVRQILLKKKKQADILELEKIMVEEELKNIETQIRLVLTSLTEKNNLIDKLENEIEKFNSLQPITTNSPDQIHLLEKLQSFKLLTNEDWEVFKKLFEKLYPEFLDRFEKLSSDITKADLRLAALIRLKLPSREIALILGISFESVQRTNLRLRKKINIETVSELDSLISSL